LRSRAGALPLQQEVRCGPNDALFVHPVALIEPDPVDGVGVGVDLHLDQLVGLTPGEQETMLAETFDTQVVGDHRSKRSHRSRRRLPADVTRNLTTGSQR
jgi:hypothetical protein